MLTDVSRILSAPGQGDPHAASRLLPLVYDELRTLAAQRMAQEQPGQTLQPTALVHEAYLRLVGQRDPGWEGRGHFFAAAAEAMRHILADDARRKRRVCRGGGLQRGRSAYPHDPRRPMAAREDHRPRCCTILAA